MLMFAVAFAANAQTIVGITGGINMANISGDDTEMLGSEPEMFMRFAAGAFLNIPISDGLAFRPEVLYAQKGAKWAGEFMGTSWESKFKLAYIEVPLMLQYTVEAGGALGILLMGGGYFGYNMSADVWAEAGAVENEEDIKDDIADFDYGVVVGGGIVISNMIEIFARYSMGLASLDDTDADLDMKNSVIEIRGSFRFGGN
jgi:hypothetical protein